MFFSGDITFFRVCACASFLLSLLYLPYQSLGTRLCYSNMPPVIWSVAVRDSTHLFVPQLRLANSAQSQRRLGLVSSPSVARVRRVFQKKGRWFAHCALLISPRGQRRAMGDALF